MDEATERTIAGLLEAMRAEAEGHHFYRMAARSCVDEKGRAVFEQLADEEHEHLEFLRAQHAAMVASGAPAPARLGRPARLEGESPIFSAAIVGRLAEAHFEMTALSVGIQLELGAQRFYREQAEAASAPTVRAFFEELAEWEAGHYRALLAQQQALKDEYWAAAGFAPF